MPAIRPVGHEERLSLIEHLDELRTRIILCIVAFVLSFSLCYWQNDRILDIINVPLDHAHRVDCKASNKKKADDALERSGCFNEAVGGYLKAAATGADARRSDARRDRRRRRRERGDADAERPDRARAAARRRPGGEGRGADAQGVDGRQPVTLGVTEPFLTTITVSAYAALLLALPFILFQLYAFVLPAFSNEERRVALPLMTMVPVLFVIGVVFGYYLALPRAVAFLQNYNDGAFDILVQAKDYYRFCTLLLAAMGVLFQIPIGVLAIVRLRILTVKQLRSYRGYALILFAIVAAVVTPTPDPFTMLIAMAPLVVLYEISLILGRIFQPTGEPRFGFLSDRDDDDAEDPADDAPAEVVDGGDPHTPNDLD